MLEQVVGPWLAVVGTGLGLCGWWLLLGGALRAARRLTWREAQLAALAAAQAAGRRELAALRRAVGEEERRLAALREAVAAQQRTLREGERAYGELWAARALARRERAAVEREQAERGAGAGQAAGAAQAGGEGAAPPPGRGGDRFAWLEIGEGEYHAE